MGGFQVIVTALIPQIFYDDVEVGVRLFRDGLGFALVYRNDDDPQPFWILRRDAVKVHVPERRTRAW